MVEPGLNSWLAHELWSDQPCRKGPTPAKLSSHNRFPVFGNYDFDAFAAGWQASRYGVFAARAWILNAPKHFNGWRWDTINRCLSIFGKNPKPHRMLAEQLTAEYYVKTEGRGCIVDEWKSRPDQPDNHWFDCLVGASMAASMQGCVLFGTDGGRTVKRNERVSFKELQKRRKS